MEDIADADTCTQEKFWNKRFRRISWLLCSKRYFILADVFENLRNMCLEIYEHDLAKFLAAPGLSWQSALKNTKVKLIF